MPPKKSAPKSITLNEEQQAVISAREGYYACYAGPGSGKTSTCVRRIASLIESGVPPDQLLALSFTATAARNLRDRVESLVGELNVTRTAGSMTLHSWAYKFATEERSEFPFELAETPLATEPVAFKLLGDVCRKHELDSRTVRPLVSVFKRNRVRASEAIRTAENNHDAKQLKIALAYKGYEKLCRENGVLDFDSLMFEAVDLMEKKPEIRTRHQYEFVTCDEGQDCSKTDWDLLKLLSEKHGNLMVVGDPGQSIFGFRAASPKLFLEMDQMFPGTKKLFLATNYRSTKQLVGFLKEIGPVPELSDKFTTPNEEGVRPEVVGFRNASEEAAFVVNKIKEGYDSK